MSNELNEVDWEVPVEVKTTVWYAFGGQSTGQSFSGVLILVQA